MKTCRNCGAHEDVRRGLCPTCRLEAHGRGGREEESPTHHEEPEPAHDQPWVPRSAFADRVRRSPRQ